MVVVVVAAVVVVQPFYKRSVSNKPTNRQKSKKIRRLPFFLAVGCFQQTLYYFLSYLKHAALRGESQAVL